MRKLRVSLVGAIVASTGAVLFAGPAAAAAPTAPYTALVVHSEGTTYVNDNSSYDLARGTLRVMEQTANGWPLEMIGETSDFKHFNNMYVIPALGTQFAAGTTYQTAPNWSATAGSTSMDVDGDGMACQAAGTLTVDEVAYDETGTITKFGASFTENCPQQTETGEIRFNSSLPYQAADSWDYLMAFGQQPVGALGAGMDATVQIDGPQSTTFGAASLSGHDPDAFMIGTNTCSGATLSFGQTCTVQILPNANAVGDQDALLTLVDSATGGKITRLARLTGVDPRGASVNPGQLYFGYVPNFSTSAPQTATITGTGSTATTFGQRQLGGDTPSAFTVTADTCSGATLASGQTCKITVDAHPTVTAQYTMATITLPSNDVAGSTVISLDVSGYESDAGTFYPLSPSRILDTRSGLGGPKAKVGANKTLTLQVTGKGGVPTSDVSAVVLNVTVTGGTASSYVTVYPSGVSMPTASSLNFVKGWTGANSVTVAVGSTGKIILHNAAGSTNMIVDVTGYYASGSTHAPVYDMGGQYIATTPGRLADTRTWTKNHAPIPGGYYISVPGSVSASVNPHIRAFAVNITAVGESASGYLTAWNGAADYLPKSSTLNYSAGKTVANFAIVPTMPCVDCGSATGLPSIGVYTSKSTGIIVDVVGYYDDSTLHNGLRFHPMVPTRIVDTRSGSHALGTGATATFTAPGRVLDSATDALALNVTAVAPTASTYLTVWPSGVGRPTVSNLNPAAHQTVPNAAQTLLGPTGAFNVYNNTGTTNVLVDVVGTFDLYPGTATAAVQSQARGFEADPAGSNLTAIGSPQLVHAIK